MGYRPGDAYTAEFTTSNPSTGAAANADSLPVATANHNGTDDATFSAALTVANIDAGRYKITGTIPTTYAEGDRLNVSIAATVNSIAGKAVVDTQVLSAIDHVSATVNDGSAAAGSFKGDSSLNGATDDFYKGSVLAFTGGTLKGIARKVTGYTASTRALAFTTAFPAAPANGDSFLIVGRIDG